MTQNPGRIRALLDDTLADEPPLLDLVPAAVSGADRRARRGRMAAAGGVAAAVLAVSVGAYGLADHGSADRGNGKATGSPTPSPAATGTSATVLDPAAHKSDFGIGGLFDHPGTPQQECAKLKIPAKTSAEQQTASQERDYCARALTQIRALLPDDVVVLQPMVDFNQPSWSQPLAKTPDGGTLAGFSTAYQQAAHDPAKVVYTTSSFAFHGPNGNGIVSYETTKPGVKAKPEPGGNLPLGDGTSAHFSQDRSGEISANGVTADGLWYELNISGVYQIYGETGGGSLSPNSSPTFKDDGLSHEVFPDGYVQAFKPGKRWSIPNPYTPAEVRDLITARGLGAMVTAIGAHPMSLFPAPN